MLRLGNQLAKRLQHETSQVHQPVWDDQVRFQDQQVTIQQNVKIDEPRPPSPRASPAHLTLNPLQNLKQRTRRERRLDLGHGVYEIRLVLRADRLRLAE
jgi:hypothetical protein